MASWAFHGSATPSPLASTPQRSHVLGMNCIQPTAPAELGPMFRPKFDSILLIEASTCHGMPYADPAPCQSALSCWKSSDCGTAGGAEIGVGMLIWPGWFGTDALGRFPATEGSTRNGSTLASASASPSRTRFIPSERRAGSESALPLREPLPVATRLLG